MRDSAILIGTLAVLLTACEEWRRDRIGGVVFINDLGAAGITVSITIQSRGTRTETVTDATGAFQFPEVDGEDVYILAVLLAPPNIEFVENNIEVLANNTRRDPASPDDKFTYVEFRGYTPTTVNGTVSWTESEAGVAGVPVQLNGLEATITDANGSYVFQDVGVVPLAAPTGTVDRTKHHLEIVPPAGMKGIGSTYAVVRVRGRPVRQDFILRFEPASASISGSVLADAQPVAGAEVEFILGAWRKATTTSSDGTYRFGSMPLGQASLTLVRFPANLYAFSSPTQAVTVTPNSYIVVDFIGRLRSNNRPPVVTITSPATGMSVAQGSPVLFTATAEDPEDGTLPASALVWISVPGGQIGTGSGFLYTLPAVGNYRVTASALDSDGATGSASIDLQVVAATGAINGAVRLYNVGQAGVPVVLGGAATATTTTDANGNYSFANLAPGTYTVTIQHGSPWFTVKSQTVTVGPSQTVTVNFFAP